MSDPKSTKAAISTPKPIDQKTTKVGFLLSGSIPPEQLELIANTIRNSKDTEFYAVTDKGIDLITTGKHADNLYMRNMLSRMATSGGLPHEDIAAIVAAKPELVKDMIFVTDNYEDPRVLNPLVRAANKQAIIVTEPNIGIDARILDGMKLIPTPDKPQTSTGLINAIASLKDITYDQSRGDSFIKEVNSTTMMAVNKQGIGGTKDFTTVFDPKTERITMIHREKDQAYSYTAGAQSFYSFKGKATTEVTLTKEQIIQVYATLKEFKGVIAVDGVLR